MKLPRTARPRKTPPPTQRANYAKDFGNVFGGYTVLGYYDRSPNGQTRYLCQCECGDKHAIERANLRGGLSKRCPNCAAKRKAKKHGLSAKPVYHHWLLNRKRLVVRWANDVALYNEECYEPHHKPRHVLQLKNEGKGRKIGPNNFEWRPIKLPQTAGPCTILGVDYPNRKAAQQALGVSRQRIHQLAKRAEIEKAESL